MLMQTGGKEEEALGEAFFDVALHLFQKRQVLRSLAGEAVLGLINGSAPSVFLNTFGECTGERTQRSDPAPPTAHE
jgi:hypothetical protein